MHSMHSIATITPQDPYTNLLSSMYSELLSSIFTPNHHYGMAVMLMDELSQNYIILPYGYGQVYGYDYF